MADRLESEGRALRWIGLAAGPALALLTFVLLPASFAATSGETVEFTLAGRATLAAMIWMAAWWLTEAIDISATALVPIVLFPLLGIASIKATTAPYASDIIFLFMGGFMLALSMQRWGLDKRIALLTLRIVGTQPRRMVAGFMIATAMISAFVSNTATAAMMLPIGMSVVQLVLGKRADSNAGGSARFADGTAERNFAVCLMLGIAYAASIGGMATIIGTPPNGILVAFLRNTIHEDYRIDMSFARWLAIGVPIAVLFLPVAWLLLTYVAFPVRLKRIEGGRGMIRDELRKLGPVRLGEWITFIVFVLAAIAWMTRPLLQSWTIGEGEGAWKPLGALSDAGIAMTAGLALFVIPLSLKRGEFAMNWSTASKLPWGILILFGGGLSLAAAIEVNGVAQFFASLAVQLRGTPPILLLIVVVASVVFLSELASNTAATATLLPVLAAIAPAVDAHPYVLVFGCALAASCGFMLPVATPPNAIVFGTGYVTMRQMCKAGLLLNVAGIVIVTLVTYLVVLPMFGE